MAYIVVWSFILACNIDSAFGDLLHVPPQAEVVRGDSVTISCVTTYAGQYHVQWQYTPVGSNGAIDIFFTGFLIRKFAGKYEVNGDKAKGEYNLTILSALPNDSGTYTCIDKGGAGQQRRSELIVLDSKPIGKSNVSLDQLAICGTNADYIGLSCQVNYTGDQSPKIEWRQIFDNGTEITLSGQLPPDVGHDSVSYHLEMRIDPSMNGSVFRCQSTLAKYSWTSEELRIQYAVDSSLIVSLQEAEEVHCRAETNQPCTYEWMLENDLQNIQSENEILDLTHVPSGTYTCRAQCNIRGEQCVIFGQTVQFTGNNASAVGSNSTALIVGIVVGIVLILLTAAAVIGIYFRYKRPKMNSEKDETTRLLSDENLTPTSGMEKLIVRGIAELDKRIYVIFQDRPFIRVISDLVKFSKKRDIHLDNMKDPWDLQSCIESKCLYVADRTPNCIWKVDPDPLSAAQPKKWMVGLKKPHKFSVISRGRIAIPKWPSSIEIFETDGSHGETIKLPIDMLEPYYVLETASNTYVVAHGHQKSLKHRVCEITKRAGQDRDWIIQWSYPENGSDKISNIDILAMDGIGRIFVTDQNNLRIIVLSESGEKLKEIHTRIFPYRLCYARNSKLLLVGHYGSISVFKFNDVKGQLKIRYKLEAVCESYPFENLSTPRKSAQNLEMHLENDEMTKMEVGEYIVRGIAELHNKFYLIFQDKNWIRVFDERCKQSEDVSVKNLVDPWFIDACPQNNCLYITDKGRECIVKIYDLEKNDGNFSVEIWKRKIGEPYKLSVTSQGHVIIPVWPAALEIYDSERQLIDTIDLPYDMLEPCHAVEVDRGSYILGHGDKKSDTHRVCKITYNSSSKSCEVVWMYGNQRGNKIDQLNRPRNISIGDRGAVFITDEGNRRLVALDNSGDLLSTETTDNTPERLFYSKSIGRLLVGHYGSVSQYVVDWEDVSELDVSQIQATFRRTETSKVVCDV